MCLFASVATWGKLACLWCCKSIPGIQPVLQREGIGFACLCLLRIVTGSGMNPSSRHSSSWLFVLHQLELFSTSMGQIWVRDSGIIPVWDVLLEKTYLEKGIFALPLWRQLFNFVGNLILPPEQNMLEIHVGIQILTWEDLISPRLSAGFLFV